MPRSESSEPGRKSTKTGSKRGRLHDAEGTREAILNAAEEVFAEHGFDGARIDAIAEKAGYNKSLIFQYFDDKLGLYAAVVRRADDQTRVLQDQAMTAFHDESVKLGPDQIKDLMRRYIGWYFDYLVEHPRVMRIFNWELAEGWQTFSKIMTQRDLDDVDQFAPIFRRFQKAGLLRLGVDPILQFTSALFMSHVYLGILPLYKVMIPNADFSSPAALKRAREFVIDFVINGFLVTPAKARP